MNMENQKILEDIDMATLECKDVIRRLEQLRKEIENGQDMGKKKEHHSR